MSSDSNLKNKFNLNHDAQNRYLCFKLGNENFAIPLLQVKEVIGIPEFTRIPYTPNYFCGIMNLRGKVISVIDLSKKLSIPSKGGDELSVIVCDLEQIVMGILVDSVNMVLNIEKVDILSKPTIQTSVKIDFIDGFFHNKDELIVFLNLVKTLSLDDIINIEKNIKL